MVQTLMVESFEEILNSRVVSVGRDTIGLRADYVLKSELREFQAEYAAAGDQGPPQIHVRINAELVAMPRRTIEAGKTFEALEPARSAAFQDIIVLAMTMLRQGPAPAGRMVADRGCADRQAGTATRLVKRPVQELFLIS